MDPTTLDRLRNSDRPELWLPEGVRRPDDAPIALLSSSFDPPTLGHLALAEASTAAGAGLTVLLYSVRTVPKTGGELRLLAEDERLRAVELVCAARPSLVPGVCSHGLLVDQAQAASERFPRAALVFLMGSDKALQVLDPSWYSDREAALETLFAHARIAYAERAGEQGAVAAALARPENERLRAFFRRLDLPAEVAGISSSDVRRRARRREDVGELVPAEVLEVVTAAAARQSAGQ